MTPDELEYLFDLRGYLILDNTLTPAQLLTINQWIDAQPKVGMGEWIGHIETHTYSGSEGINYQNIVEGGRVFEEIIANPAWITLVRQFICNGYTAQLSLHEAFLNVRGASDYIGLHSGGHTALPYMNTRHHTGIWNVGQINVLTALTDIGPGDGATVVIPGSHKSHTIHPHLAESPHKGYRSDVAAGEAMATVEVHLKAGQSVFFTDAICHGSAARTNPGQRRTLVYRYSPEHIRARFNYVPSPELLARLTPEARAIVQPMPPRMRPGRTLTAAAPVKK